MTMTRKCDNCNKEYDADPRNIKRGWGLTCCKSCAASIREKRKPGYSAETVRMNNTLRENRKAQPNILDKRLGDQSFVDDADKWGDYRGRTSEGYRIYGAMCFDKWGEPMYSVD